MAEPEKVKYARQVVAQQMLADAVRALHVSWEDYPRLSEREFIAAEALALQVEAPPADQYSAAYEFLASLAVNDEDSSRARGGIEPMPHLHLELETAAIAAPGHVWQVSESLTVRYVGESYEEVFAKRVDVVAQVLISTNPTSAGDRLEQLPHAAQDRWRTRARAVLLALEEVPGA